MKVRIPVSRIEPLGSRIAPATLNVKGGGERDAADAFAPSPTVPGPTGLASDFFLRETTV